MSGDLLKAHADLDRSIDAAFELAEPNPTFLRRQEVLFAAYESLTSPLLSARAPVKRAAANGRRRARR